MNSAREITESPQAGFPARYELLDPLRGVAILAVMLLHFCERGTPSGDDLIHGRLWPIVQHGYLGVQLFFVISGYCITAALYSAAKKEAPLTFFMKRRLRRIFPPYWASMALVVVLGIATIVILKTPASVVFPLTAFDWMCNVLLIQGPMHGPDVNLVYWSLSIELQFYAVMAIALLWPRYTEAWLILVSIAFLIIREVASVSLWGTLLVYWPEFLCGIAAYYWLTKRMKYRHTPTILMALVVVDMLLQSAEYRVLVQSNGRFIAPIKMLFCLMCMSVLLLCRRHDAWICRRKSVRGLAWFGLISYSLYLTHVPIATRLFNLTQRFTSLEGIRWLVPALASMIVCTVFGWIFYRYFEKPWLNSPAVQSAAVPEVRAAHIPTKVTS